MAQFTATIQYPDNKQTELRDAISFELGYEPTVPDGNGGTIPNPQSKAQFIQAKANEMLLAWVTNTYKSGKTRTAIIDTTLGGTV